MNKRILRSKVTRRLLPSVVISLVLLIVLPTVALAIINPTYYSTYPPVQFYRNILTPGDMGILGKYNITHAATPTETAAQAYLVTLLDSTGNVTMSVTPVAYQNKGYGDGMFWMYINPGITWSSNCTIRLQGNPALTWSGAIPLVDMTNFTWNSDTTGLGTQILTYAQELETSWGIATYDLVTYGDLGNKLAAQGVTYCTSVIPNLRTIAPSIFSTSLITPSFDKQDKSKRYQVELWGGGVWDTASYRTYFTNLAGYIDTSSNVLRLLVFFILVATTFVLVAREVKQGWCWPIILSPLLYFGNMSGLLLLGITVLIGFVFFFLGVFVFLYKRVSM